MFGEVAKDIVKSGNDVTFDMSGKTEKEVIIAKKAEVVEDAFKVKLVLSNFTVAASAI